MESERPTSAPSGGQQGDGKGLRRRPSSADTRPRPQDTGQVGVVQQMNSQDESASFAVRLKLRPKPTDVQEAVLVAPGEPLPPPPPPSRRKPTKEDENVVWAPRRRPPLHVFRPCVHLFFQTPVTPREGLTRKQHLEILAAPRELPWQDVIDPDPGLYKYRRARPSWRLPAMSLPSKRYLRGSLRDNYCVLSRPRVQKLVDMLQEEMHVSHKGMSTVVEFLDPAGNLLERRSLRPVKAGRKDKAAGLVAATAIRHDRVRNSKRLRKWAANVGKLVGDQILQWLEEPTIMERSGRLQALAAAALVRLRELARAAGDDDDEAAMKPRSAANDFLELLAERLALWMNGVLRRSASQHDIRIVAHLRRDHCLRCERPVEFGAGFDDSAVRMPDGLWWYPKPLPPQPEVYPPRHRCFADSVFNRDAMVPSAGSRPPKVPESFPKPHHCDFEPACKPPERISAYEVYKKLYKRYPRRPEQLPKHDCLGVFHDGHDGHDGDRFGGDDGRGGRGGRGRGRGGRGRKGGRGDDSDWATDGEDDGGGFGVAVGVRVGIDIDGGGRGDGGSDGDGSGAGDGGRGGGGRGGGRGDGHGHGGKAHAGRKSQRMSRFSMKGRASMKGMRPGGRKSHGAKRPSVEPYMDRLKKQVEAKDRGQAPPGEGPDWSAALGPLPDDVSPFAPPLPGMRASQLPPPPGSQLPPAAPGVPFAPLAPGLPYPPVAPPGGAPGGAPGAPDRDTAGAAMTTTEGAVSFAPHPDAGAGGAGVGGARRLEDGAPGAGAVGGDAGAGAPRPGAPGTEGAPTPGAPGGAPFPGAPGAGMFPGAYPGAPGAGLYPGAAGDGAYPGAPGAGGYPGAPGAGAYPGAGLLGAPPPGTAAPAAAYPGAAFLGTTGAPSPIPSKPGGAPPGAFPGAPFPSGVAPPGAAPGTAPYPGTAAAPYPGAIPGVAPYPFGVAPPGAPYPGAADPKTAPYPGAIPVISAYPSGITLPGAPYPGATAGKTAPYPGTAAAPYPGAIPGVAPYPSGVAPPGALYPGAAAPGAAPYPGAVPGVAPYPGAGPPIAGGMLPVPPYALGAPGTAFPPGVPPHAGAPGAAPHPGVTPYPGAAVPGAGYPGAAVPGASYPGSAVPGAGYLGAPPGVARYPGVAPGAAATYTGYRPAVAEYPRSLPPQFGLEPKPIIGVPHPCQKPVIVVEDNLEEETKYREISLEEPKDILVFGPTVDKWEEYIYHINVLGDEGTLEVDRIDEGHPLPNCVLRERAEDRRLMDYYGPGYTDCPCSEGFQHDLADLEEDDENQYEDIEFEETEDEEDGGEGEAPAKPKQRDHTPCPRIPIGFAAEIWPDPKKTCRDYGSGDKQTESAKLLARILESMPVAIRKAAQAPVTELRKRLSGFIFGYLKQLIDGNRKIGPASQDIAGMVSDEVAAWLESICLDAKRACDFGVDSDTVTKQITEAMEVFYERWEKEDPCTCVDVFDGECAPDCSEICNDVLPPPPEEKREPMSLDALQAMATFMSA